MWQIVPQKAALPTATAASPPAATHRRVTFVHVSDAQ